MAKRQTAAPPPVPDVEVLDPVSPEQQLVTTEGGKLRTFLSLGEITRFFKRAGEIERAAKERLDIARQLKPPTDAPSDEKIQLFIKAVKDDITIAEEHWGIAAVLHHLHRAITAARSRTTGKDSKGNPTGMLDQAAGLAQALHNRYVEDERRRAQEEQARLNREAEQRAQEQRERELAELEAAALKAEAASPELSERERLFVDYFTGPYQNASRAAQQAGFKDPDTQSARLLKSPKVVKAIEAKRAANTIRTQAAAKREMPVQYETTTVQPNISRAAGAHDRTTHGAEVTDEQALLVAALDPMMRTRLGIPADIVMINRSKVNEYGSSLKELIEKWPGVRHTKKTTTV